MNHTYIIKIKFNLLEEQLRFCRMPKYIIKYAKKKYFNNPIISNKKCKKNKERKRKEKHSKLFFLLQTY